MRGLSPRGLLSVSAATFGVAGLALLFLPGEIGRAIGVPAEGELPTQLVSGGFLALAILDWTGRGAVYGGIYGRPLVLANLAFGMVSGGSLASAALDGRVGPWAWGPAGVLLVHAALFGWLMRRPPWIQGQAPGDG